MAKKRRPTICQACGFNSWDGRVCRGCKAYYGTAEDAIAGSALARSLEGATWDHVFGILASLVDVIVPDWPGPNLQSILHSTPSVPQIGGTDHVGVDDA